MKKLLPFILYGAKAFAEDAVNSIDDFHPKFFWNRPKEGFYEIKSGLKDPNFEGMKVVAFGDLNNDMHVDVVTLNADMDTFTVHYYDPVTLTYSPSQPVHVDTTSNSKIRVESIVLSKNVQELQNLYVVYYSGSQSQPTLKVFKQEK